MLLWNVVVRCDLLLDDLIQLLIDLLEVTLIRHNLRRYRLQIGFFRRVFVFAKNLEGVRDIEPWMEHMEMLRADPGTSVVLLVDHVDTIFRLLMLRVDLEDSGVGDDCFAALVTLLVEDSEVIPDFAVVRLQVLCLENGVEGFLILSLLVKKDGVRNQIRRLR